MREFTEQSGPQLEGKVDRATGTLLDYFFILFPLALLQLLVVHTNAYATFCMARDGPDSSWAEVTETEMGAFLSINILMGIVQMPMTDMYWSSDMFFELPGVQMTMTRNRY
ncbi:hypothetical protein DPMN_160754 [Dreissena polymorpha]|uniref:PiggyBac transposable element-derived protein domain-containing protein n=1 Tax=Dreissena polymorpha TaxID=45954 RepID=A0A9D4ENR2_DREPO|nr:hypothetical protein DPMN_160754 [Dreissena polymorpha]